MDKLGYVVKNISTGRGKHAGAGGIFQVGGSWGYYIWVGDVGDDPSHGPGPGVFPVQGGPSDHSKASTEDSGK